jgi:hypothetical protein
MRRFFNMPYWDKRLGNEMQFKTSTVLNKILQDSKKCVRYASLNNHIRFLPDLAVGTEIVAFIKNIREYCVFCSLNLGVSGVFRDD